MWLFEANNGEGTREWGEIEISALSRISHKKDARKTPRIFLVGEKNVFKRKNENL